MKFPIRDFFSKCDQIRRKLRIWSDLLKKSLMKNFIFCVVRFRPTACFCHSVEVLRRLVEILAQWFGNMKENVLDFEPIINRADIYLLKLTIKTLEIGVKYVQS